MYTLASLFLLFIIYSVIGYIIEIVAIYMNSNELNFSRGFLIGPVLPIFGFGGLLMYLYLYKYYDDLVALFIMSLVMCTILEYVTSYLMELVFKLRWWDYSEKKFNLNGRVCLSNAIGFGIAGIIIIRLVNPIILNFVYSLPINALYTISGISFTIFFIDVLLSLNILIKLKIDISTINGKDVTPFIKKAVRKELSRTPIFTRRLVNAFPDLSKLNKSFRKYKVQKFIFSKDKFRIFKNKKKH